jgi:cytidine deaminase
MAEFALDMPVFIVNGQGAVTARTTVRDLLPDAFTPEKLGVRP